MIKELKNYINIVDKHADYFCREENRGQLEWVMWRWCNLFYAARLMNKGYDDSIFYFIEGYVKFKCTLEQSEIIENATSAGMHLGEWGWLNNNKISSSFPQLSTTEIHELENSPIPEFTQLYIKPNKTWDDWISIVQHPNYPYNTSNKGNSSKDIEKMYFTYYSGFSFKNGYLVSDNELEHDLTFPIKGKDVPVNILKELNTILESNSIVELQNKAKAKWEVKMCDYFSKLLGQHVKEALKRQKKELKDVSLEKWYEIEKIILDGPPPTFEEMEKMCPGIKKMSPTKYLNIHGGNVIANVTRNSHPSYIEVAKRICNEILVSEEEEVKQKQYAQNILNKLK